MSLENVIRTDVVVVDRLQMDALLDEVAQIRQQKAHLSITEKVALLADGGTLNTKAVCKLTGWSDSTFRRRVAAAEIPMVQDGRDYRISTESFLKWYSINF